MAKLSKKQRKRKQKKNRTAVRMKGNWKRGIQALKELEGV